MAHPGGGLSGPSSLGGTNSSFAPAPPPTSPTTPQGPGGGGFNLFGGPPQGAGFGQTGTTVNPFGIGFVPPTPGQQAGDPGLAGIPGGSISPDQLVGLLTGFGGGISGPGGQQSDLGRLGITQRENFPNEGVGGFSASPRILTPFEIQAINRELGTVGTTSAFNPSSFQARQQLGPFGFIADPSTFGRSQIPLIETRLNFENLLQAQTDRQSALDLLGQQRNVIGETPEQQFALETALRRLQSPEPFSPEEVALQTGEIRSRGARGLETAQRGLAESFGQQGLAGSATSFQGAQLQQAADRQASDELSRLALTNALQRDANEAAAVDRLQGITGQNELRQIALNEALAELLTAQRGQFDLSSLAGIERKADPGLLTRIGFF